MVSVPRSARPKPRLRSARPKFNYLRAVRLFAQGLWCHFYDTPGGVVDPPTSDVYVGLDYYENLFVCKQDWGIFAFTNAAFRHTNFSLDDYNAFVWSRNVKTGPKMPLAKSILVPYAVVD